VPQQAVYYNGDVRSRSKFRFGGARGGRNMNAALKVGRGVMDQAMSPGRYCLARLSSVELYVVHRFVDTTRHRLVRAAAIAVNWLGDGWFYLVLAAASIMAAGEKALPVVAVGALSAGVLHCLYPVLKRWIARPRPYQRDASLVPLLAAMDEHSFPSGHAMTMSAALVPLVLGFPQMLGLAIALWLLSAWARLASAHHYPSDVAVGAMLGVSVSYPISIYALSATQLVS
jgi:undecaprenyl-diphosphatase